MKRIIQSLTASYLIGLSALLIGCAHQQPFGDGGQLSANEAALEAQAAPEVQARLASQRQFIASQNLKFKVGVTPVSSRRLEEITGEREVPREEMLKIQQVMRDKQFHPEVLKWLKEFQL